MGAWPQHAPRRTGSAPVPRGSNMANTEVRHALRSARSPSLRRLLGAALGADRRRARSRRPGPRQVPRRRLLGVRQARARAARHGPGAARALERGASRVEPGPAALTHGS
ncbi:hypothetical protein Anae109_0767 [Anaeromyxobacter sp. Fw109-5]|nr:hypothetical protein Anae109_0767 [Anaeromyxobacter sp. Fw109-5]